MKVKELIKLLQEADPDGELEILVCIDKDEYDNCRLVKKMSDEDKNNFVVLY